MTKQDLYTYTEMDLQSMQTGLFHFWAHPEVFAYITRFGMSRLKLVQEPLSSVL